MKTETTLSASDFPDTVDALLNSPGWEYFESDRLGNDLFISDPERAGRIHAAAEDGCDGSTHAEHIQDWRDYAEQLREDYERHAWNMESEEEAEAFEAELETRADALAEAIDACEAWHEANGSLWEMVG